MNNLKTGVEDTLEELEDYPEDLDDLEDELDLQLDEDLEDSDLDSMDQL